MTSIYPAIKSLMHDIRVIDDETIEVTNPIDLEDVRTTNIYSPEARTYISDFIYNKFHACMEQIKPATTKVDIFRHLRSFSTLDRYLPEHLFGPQQPKISLNRSPGFIHIFGDQGWPSNNPSVGRIYISSLNAIERTNLFTTLIEPLERLSYPFQCKMSWNPEVRRSDDIVVYFPIGSGFNEARILVRETLQARELGSFEMPKSIFTNRLTHYSSEAIEESSLENQGMSFGSKRSTFCAELILAILTGKPGDFEHIAQSWNVDLSDLFH